MWLFQLLFVKRLAVYCPFLIKKSQELGIEGNLFNIIKGICEKPAGTIILKAKRLNAFSLDQAPDSMPAFTSALQHCSGSSSRSSQTRNRSKIPWIQIAKDEVKPYLPMT